MLEEDFLDHQVECPSCRETVFLIYKNSVFANCKNCNSIFVVKPSRPENAILGQNKKNSYALIRYLEIGQKFIYNETAYIITGRAVIKVKFEGTDSNEAYKGSLIYHEWVCRSKDSQYFTITEDYAGFHISMPVEPDPEVDQYFIRNSFMQIYSDMAPKKIDETGIGKVIYFEGEADDNYYPGRELSYATCTYKGYTYGAEWNPYKKDVSVNFYVQSVMPKNTLHKMIYEKNDMSNYNKKLKEFNFLRKAVTVTALILFILMAFSTGEKGKMMYEKRIKMLDITEAGYKLPTFEINELNTPYSIKTIANVPSSNTEMLVGVEITNKNENVVNLLEKWFWTASGSYEGEAWRESDVEMTSYFKFDKKGTYQPILYLEKSTATKTITDGYYVNLYIRKGVMMTRYFLYTLIFFIILIIILYLPGTSHYIKSWYFQKLKI
ncbi:MAG: hypothetical protein CMO01_20485 [Thalassobius sp.]|nr:hypothetical protein [Thalassovita sp.]